MPISNSELSIIIRLRDLASRQLQGMGQRFRRFAQSFRANWLAVTAAVTATTLAIRSLLRTGIDFEEAFTGVRKTVDATEEEFARLRENFRKLSLTMPVTASELAKIGEIAGQLGIRGVNNLTKFTKVIAQLGITTDIQGEQAALSLSRFINVIGGSQENVDRLGATIVDLGNKFAARESEIIDIAKNLASFGRQVNLTEAQTLAFAAAIKASGGEAQAASTAFQKVALIMKDAVITGNENLQKFAKVAGQTAEEFRRAFQEDAAQAIVSFIDGLRRIDEAGGSVRSTLEEVGLADVRLVREFGKVTANIGDLVEALKVADEAWRSNSALTEEAAKRAESTASKIKQLTIAFENLKITLFDRVAPALKNFTEQLTILLGGMSTQEIRAREAVAQLLEYNEKIQQVKNSTQELTPEQERLIRQFELWVEEAQVAVNEWGNYTLAISVAKDATEAANRIFADLNVTLEETKQVADDAGEALEDMSQEGEKSAKKTKKEFGAMGQFLSDTATAMSNSMSDFFFKVFTREVKSAKDVFREFGRAMLRIIADLIARWIVFSVILKALQAVPGIGPIATAVSSVGGFGGPTPQTKHLGGPVMPSYQFGGEVPALVQPGEFIVNRRAATRNRGLLEQINRGEPMEESAQPVVVVNLSAIDPQTGAEFLLRNANTIAEAVSREILQNNGQLRKIQRRFA